MGQWKREMETMDWGERHKKATPQMDATDGSKTKIRNPSVFLIRDIQLGTRACGIRQLPTRKQRRR